MSDRLRIGKFEYSDVYELYLREHIWDPTTLSEIELKEFYTPRDELSREEPGKYPFTRGIYKNMYRGRLWTRRQQSGYGTPEQSNERLRFLISQGQTGLNIDFDVPVKLGLDPDHPMAKYDVGQTGTSIATLDDIQRLFEGIPLDAVSSTLIVQPPYSSYIMAAYILAAKSNGVDPAKLRGTVMNCAFTQLVGPAYKANTTFFPIDYAVKLGLDLMEYCIKNLPKWNILNINAYNMRETGIDGVQEIAFTIALAMDYMDLLIERGLSVDDFGKRIAVFAAVHLNFLEEVAKLRAMRRLWAKMMKDLYGASDDVCRLKIAVQTSALPLTAQQPLNNIVRISIQTLAAVLAGVQSIHTTGYDEAYSLPTELSHELSLRTQQIIAYETDVAKTADPLGGSYAIEWLTDELEERALNLIDKIKGMGGFIECFKKGWIEEQINDARFKYWRRIEDGEKVVVGINAFRKVEEDVQIQIFRDENLMRKVLEDRLNYIKRYRRGRDEQKVKDALDKLYGKAVGEREINLMEFVINAVKSGATLQEVIDVFRVAKNFSIPGGLIWS